MILYIYVASRSERLHPNDNVRWVIVLLSQQCTLQYPIVLHVHNKKRNQTVQMGSLQSSYTIKILI